jgi:hypothetical protein
VKDKSDIDLVVYMLDMNMYTTKSISDLSFTAVPLPREPPYNKSIHISNMYTTKSISDLSFTAVPLPREPLYNKSIHISNMYTTKST